MSDRTLGSRPDTLERLVAYSAAAGLGAFAFGQEAQALIVYTDIPDLQVNRGDGFEIDFDNDGYVDVTLLNTLGGGFGYGTVQWRGTVENYGLPGSSPLYPSRGAGYSITNTAFGGSAYYVNSFDSGDIIGPGNAAAQDITPNGGGNFYGLVSSYGGYGGHTFWDSNEYAGIRFVDGNGDNRYGWARFQITVNDVVDANGLPFPDGIIDFRDGQVDPNRFVTIFEYAYETTPDLDILAGDIGAPLIPGDLDGDGFVGIADLNIVLGEWNNTVPPADPLADPSGDGFVGIEDLNMVLGDWNAGTPPTGGAAVPEPTSLAMLAVGGGALAFARRRRKQ